MPRGAPRGLAIFCRTTEGSGKTASVFRHSLFLRLTGVSINAIIVLQSSSSLYRGTLVAIRKTQRISNYQGRSFVQEHEFRCVKHVSFSVNFLFLPPIRRLTFQYIEPIDAVRSLANGLVNCIDAQTAGESAAVEQAQQLGIFLSSLHIQMISSIVEMICIL